MGVEFCQMLFLYQLTWSYDFYSLASLFFYFNLFIIFGCVGSSLLLFVVLRGLLIAVPPLVAEHGL